jgi:aerobic carbon-monoxide dehydrogenase small subunit
MAEHITLKVNGVERTVLLEGHEKLIDILRDQLDLTGVKRACDDATCGACTVVVNGEAVLSCVLAASKCAGADVVTIEGLAKDVSHLHPIQQALVDAGAVQCGFCIPGIVLRLYALFSRDPAADDDKIVDALEQHFCRCTGYEAILEGARLARKYLQAGRS